MLCLCRLLVGCPALAQDAAKCAPDLPQSVAGLAQLGLDDRAADCRNPCAVWNKRQDAGSAGNRSRSGGAFGSYGAVVQQIQEPSCNTFGSKSFVKTSTR